ncbi:hypothetical protein [Oryza sativa Japonica Group]|uniref:Uncharacterized protein n=1 Tax=Oryza sativa subsp. japonica TaxID=39947 RepID=Q8RYN0_ORYSJ|nr:hypothetical protein [Oryza sativa Japonica Group]
MVLNKTTTRARRAVPVLASLRTCQRHPAMPVWCYGGHIASTTLWYCYYRHVRNEIQPFSQQGHDWKRCETTLETGEVQSPPMSSNPRSDVASSDVKHIETKRRRILALVEKSFVATKKSWHQY